MGEHRAARPRVVVVGGGLAGIAAALCAADGGADVTLLEARPRLGGATFSFDRDGLSVDNGQHVFLRCCTAYRTLLERLGVTGLTRLQDRLTVPVLRPGHRPTGLRRANLPAPLHLGGSVARYGALTPADRLRAGRAVLALRRLDPADPALDEQCFGDWLARHGQRPAAVRALWDLVCVATLNAPAAGASLALAAMVFRTGLLDQAAAGDIGIARVPLGDLHDTPARRALTATGARVHLGRKAREILVAGGEVAGVRADGETLPADAVVVAVPHDVAARMLPPGAVENPAHLAALGAAPIVNVHVRYDRRVLDFPFAAGVDSPVQWVFDRTAASGAGRGAGGDAGGIRGQYLALSLSAADAIIQKPTRELRETYVPALAALLPAAATARVEDFFVTREPRATFRQRPGTAKLRPAASTRIPGLWLAGAYTDTTWPATMEGAVRSGVTAAQQVLGQRPIHPITASTT